MILQEQALLERAGKVLGVAVGEAEQKIRYAYYRLMFRHHPDRNPEDPCAHEKTALVKEAFDFVMGRRRDAIFLKRDALVSMLTDSVVTELERLLSYEDWIKNQFYNTEEKSIWAY